MYGKTDKKNNNNSKDTAKERLHLVLMQDRANVSADFLDLMKQEIIEVIKKYIDVDESAIDVRMTNKQNDDGTNGAPALYANIPILSIKDDILREKNKEEENKETKENTVDTEKTEGKKVEEKKEVENKEEVKTEEKNEPVNKEAETQGATNK
ncbi:MAG: cell division topological specificity factor MinE [Clostridia bacterium]|nr:cell division topological specificity factor MinE [Clostridia bacterium]